MTMYPGDSYSEWAEYLNELPAEWINAYDKNGTIFKKKIVRYPGHACYLFAGQVEKGNFERCLR
jgi:hypothetical protein